MPDFFICGAAKAGTTSLWRYLLQHPSIFMPASAQHKEPGYFSALRPMNDEARYRRLFAEARPDQRVGEASGAYLTSPDSAGRIRAAVPEARIIIMLRNPADRAYSLYHWMTREGYEPAPSFEHALAREPERLQDAAFRRSNPEYYFNYLYLSSGRYADQVERYLKAFPRERLHVILFDDFRRDPVAATRGVYRFLDVDDTFMPTIDVHNAGREVWSPRVQFALRQRVLPWARRRGGPQAARLVRMLMRWNMRAKRPLARSLRRHLLDLLAADIQRTGALLNRDLAAQWLQEASL
jgi:hypothetical protein